MKQCKTKPLDKLTDEELRALAASRGLVLGRTLTHSQLVALLEGEEEEEECDAPTTTRFSSPSQRFSTVSLARILAAQGLSQEAAAVCRRVLARSPGERRARRLLAEVAPGESQGWDSTAPPPPAEPPGPLARLPLPHEYGRSLCFLMSRQARQLFLLWEVALELDERGAERAGPGACRVARLHSVWLTERGVASVCRDLTVDDRCGERFLDDCQAAAIHRAALGWLTAEGRFFSLCHSGPVRTPSAEPSLPGPASWHRPRWNLSVSPEVEPALALARRLRSGPTTS